MASLPHLIPIEHHQYDVLLKHKNPMLMRLQDAHHQQIGVGDLVEIQGHNNIMDRQRFKVVNTMRHPTIHSAMSHIEGSHGLAVRDKIKMKDAFVHAHGSQAHGQPIVSIHLEPHPQMPAGGAGTLKQL